MRYRISIYSNDPDSTVVTWGPIVVRLGKGGKKEIQRRNKKRVEGGVGFKRGERASGEESKEKRHPYKFV